MKYEGFVILVLGSLQSHAVIVDVVGGVITYLVLEQLTSAFLNWLLSMIFNVTKTAAPRATRGGKSDLSM